MRLLESLSEATLGRALIAYSLDLPRWTLASALVAVALLPAYMALTNGLLLGVGAATLPTLPVFAGMINMAASHTAENAPRLRDVFAYPSTLFTVFAVWIAVVIPLTVFLAGVSLVAVFAIGIIIFSLALVGVFAIFLPSQLKVDGLLIWRNALVLAVSYPIIGLGLLALGGVGVWAVWISKGALIVVVPSLWVVLAAFTIDDRIKAMQTAQTGQI